MAKKEIRIGTVSNYFDHVGVAAIKLEGNVKVGDTLKFEGGDKNFEQKVESMQIHKVQIKSAKKGDEIGLKVKERVRKGYRVFKA